MLEAELFAVLGVIVIVLGSVFANRLGVALPIIMVLVGVGGSFLPMLANFHVPPELILAVVLPPILYGAAVNMPTTDFRRNFGPITALSVALVLISAFGAGALIYFAFPKLSFASAVAVGAVISPPDAVAATSIGKRLGLPPRLVTILEGEGLVNDATALVLLRSAIAAVGTTFPLWQGIADFGYAVLVAAIIGAFVGALATWFRARIAQTHLTTAVSFAVPFLAYLPTEHLGASGVLAVVVAGLIAGRMGPQRLTAEARMSERMNWRTIQLLLENGVFLLMGLQLSSVLAGLRSSDLSVWDAILIGLAATVVLIVLRAVFMVLLVLQQRRSQARHARRFEHYKAFVKGRGRERLHPESRAGRMLKKRVSDVKFYATETLSWRGGAVLAWSGMRGVVTLAAAQSLPESLPYRPQLIMIAFTVAIVTLLLQGTSLPWVIAKLGIRGTPSEVLEYERAQLLQLLKSASTEALTSPSLRRADGSEFSPELVERLRRHNDAVLQRLSVKEPKSAGVAQQERAELQRLVINAEYAALQLARSSGEFRSETIARAQGMIDENALRLSRSERNHS